MPEPNPAPVGDPTPKDPVGGSPDPNQSPPATPFRVFATEDDYKAYEAKRAEKFEKELAKLRRENEELKTKHLSVEEQKAEEQRQAVEAERVKILEEADRRAGFIGVALSNGLTREQAGKWYTLAGDEWADPQDAFLAVQKELGVNIKGTNSRPVAGGGRNPDSSDEERYTPEYVEEMIFKHGSGWYSSRRAKIEAWQSANSENTIRRLS